MSLRFHLPLGQPGLVANAGDADDYRQTVVFNGMPFGGDNGFAVYSHPNGALPNAYRPVVALAGGVAWYEPDSHFVRLQLMASTTRELRDTLDPTIPVPIRFIYGPVEWPHDGESVTVRAGEVIAPLQGHDFVICALSQDDFFLDPRHVFERFGQHDLWELPAGVRCPLLPAGQLTEPFAVAGPQALPLGRPHLVLSGGSLPLVVHNPPDPLPPAYFSFISGDALNVSVRNLPAGPNPTMRFTDISDPATRTRSVPAHFDLPAGSQWTLVPHDVRKSHHPPYARANGKRTPSPPLAYTLRVTLDNAETLTTTVKQDARDVIRQEYLCHSRPFQTGGPDLPIPTRVTVEPNVPPPFVRFFKAADLRTSNYGAGQGDWLLNATEAYYVAEYMRRRFAERLAARAVAGTLPPLITFYGLNVSSGWRNPERNEAVGGVRNSNHQFGRALDLQSVHLRKEARFSEQRKALNEELFQAGRLFLSELMTLNPAARCTSVEILLEQNTTLLWSYKAKSNGVIESRKGVRYNAVVGAAPADETQAIRRAADHATHVHIGWKSTAPATPLWLPVVPPYVEVAPSLTNLYRNVILIADEHGSVSPADQLPLNHVAESLKLHLESIDPQTPTDIHVVGNALDYLGQCNAFRPPPYKIRYFFSFNHAWPGGLTLTNYDSSIPYLQPAGSVGPEIHDQELFERINFLYGDRRPKDDVAFDITSASDYYPLPVGDDDTTEIKTHQIRVSNLYLLPPEAWDNMRLTFSEAAGVYVVGCRSAQSSAVEFLSFAQAFADAIKRPVYGASHYREVFRSEVGGHWVPANLVRSSPAFDYAQNPVALIPGGSGGAQYIEYLLQHQGDPSPLPNPQTADLIKLYRTRLTRCDPVEE